MDNLGDLDVLGVLSFGLALISIVCIIYGLYFFLVLHNRKAISNFQNTLFTCQRSNSALESVSIIVSAYNEEKVIARKLKNIADLNYPKEKIEVLVIDDASTDETGNIARKTIQELGLFGKVITHSDRLGLNKSLNLAMDQAANNFVCISDSDVLLESNALKNAVIILKEFKDSGGVTGKVQPVFEGKGFTQENEISYREFYDKSMLGESSLHSAFPGNGPLIVFDKSKVPFSIPVEYGSTDGNIAINIIKSGLRFIYVPNALIFEPEAENVEQQRIQKVRRAKRLIQVFHHNMDVFFNKKYGNFGQIVFPLKFMMLSVCPVLIFTGMFLIVTSVLLFQNLLLYSFSALAICAVVGVLVLSNKLKNMVTSFVLHQIYLFAGLILSMQKSIYWKTIERKKPNHYQRE